MSAVRGTLLSYAAVSSLCFGFCSLLLLSGTALAFRDGVKAVIYCCLGPASGGAFGAALLILIAVALGLLYPRNPLARLIGSLGLALWFALGLVFTAQRFA